ncbi:MAG: sensor histidine kinase [Actinobacteria bacterium]|uniref:histidine kinase n=1 Tax=freshwater metagenome TaxID=449393 RepID=A0A6J6NEP4_9ZZZZ|nr:sensor histidine kinase [Actinomycetota bacterium]
MRAVALDRIWLRPRPSARQRRVDLVGAVLAAAVSLLVVELYRSAFGAEMGWRGVEAYLWFGLGGLVLAGRRSHPLLSLAVQSAIFIVVGERLGVLGATFPIQMILFAGLYAAWAWSRHPRALYAVTAAVLAAMFGWLLFRLLEPGGLPTADQGGRLDPAGSALAYGLMINLVYFLGAIAWGHVAWRGARERMAAEHQTALELALVEQQQARAISEERVRIARDLHDVVAHHVSGMGVQAAGAQRMLSLDPDAAREALGTIAASSRTAVSQMHELVHLLREPGAESSGRAPQPGLEDLALLADTDGQPVVEHRVVGAAFAVPPTTSLSLFRIAQEAITNVRRHAGARHASIVLRYLDTPRAVEVEVVDDGRGASAAVSGSGESGGYGLTGIRERAALHRGETEIGSRPAGGFRVRVRIPVSDA